LIKFGVWQTMSRERMVKHLHEKNLVRILKPCVRPLNKRSDSLRGLGHQFSLCAGDVPNLCQLFPEPSQLYCQQLQRKICEFLVAEELTKNDVRTITLHHSLRLTAGRDNGLIIHASPKISGEPWYDDILYLYEEEPQHVYYAARMVAFVFISTSRRDHILAYAHQFCNVRTQQNKRRRQERAMDHNATYNVEHPTFSPADAKCAPLSYMKLAWKSAERPTTVLIDTECISSGVWTQEDYDHAGNFWFIRSWHNIQGQAEGLL